MAIPLARFRDPGRAGRAEIARAEQIVRGLAIPAQRLMQIFPRLGMYLAHVVGKLNVQRRH
jgi:hypothetical protein